MTENNEAAFKQKDVAILRAALARISRMGPAPYAASMMALKQFSEAIKHYCQCTDVTFVAAEKKMACLDCGNRHEPSAQLSLV